MGTLLGTPRLHRRSRFEKLLIHTAPHPHNLTRHWRPDALREDPRAEKGPATMNAVVGALRAAYSAMPKPWLVRARDSIQRAPGALEGRAAGAAALFPDPDTHAGARTLRRR